MIQSASGPAVASETCTAQGGTCAAAGTGPRFGLKFLFLAVTLAGIWGALFRVQNGWSMGVVSVILLTWLFGCPRTRAATLTVSAAMYLPFAWLLLIDYPWNEYRWQWIRMWGSLPGLLPMRVFSNSEGVYLSGSMILTGAGFLTAVTTVRFVRSAWYWMTILVTIICCIFAWVSLMAFLM